MYSSSFWVSQSAVSYTSISSGGSPLQIQYYSRRSSVHSNTEPQEVADANVKFVRDTSRIWYKPNISREQGNYFYYSTYSFTVEWFVILIAEWSNRNNLNFITKPRYIYITLKETSIFSDLDAERCDTWYICGARQQFVPGCLRAGIESCNTSSRRAQQPARSFERARQALPDRANVTRRQTKGMRERAGLQLTLSLGLPAQSDGDGVTLPTAATWAGSSCQSPRFTWY